MAGKTLSFRLRSYGKPLIDTGFWESRLSQSELNSRTLNNAQKNQLLERGEQPDGECLELVATY